MSVNVRLVEQGLLKPEGMDEQHVAELASQALREPCTVEFNGGFAEVRTEWDGEPWPVGFVPNSYGYDVERVVAAFPEGSFICWFDEDEFAFYDVCNVAGKPVWRFSSPCREGLFPAC